MKKIFFTLALVAGLASFAGKARAQFTPYQFTYSGSIVSFTIPQDGIYQLTAAGASGANGFADGGAGAVLSGKISLYSGVVLNIAVGGSPSPGTSTGGGGGGTFVYTTTSTPLIIAGGGGGGGNSFGGSGGVGTTNTGGAGTGGVGDSGAGGAGFYGDGGNSQPLPGLVTGGKAAPDFGGGSGAYGGGSGGWGGGGGSLNAAGGGGGGYNGGYGGAYTGTGGGGGSSFLAADFFSVSGTSGANFGNGYFTLTEIQSVPEPSTYALFGLGVIGMLMVMRRKKTA